MFAVNGGNGPKALTLALASAGLGRGCALRPLRILSTGGFCAGAQLDDTGG